MATDDERRRVAAALREYASFNCEDEGEEECLVDCADWGERVLNLLGCGDTEGECYAALADLIGPAPKCSEATPKCDRGALLALADELANVRRWSCYTDSDLLDIADRIREACGEVSEG